MDLLFTEYHMKVDRKSVKRNLINLIESGYNIEYSENIRIITGKDGTTEKSYIMSDFYLVRDFTNGELRLLIDSLLVFKHIPSTQRKDLIEKLQSLSSKYFQSNTLYYNIPPNPSSVNNQLFLTIEVLDKAIYYGKQVSFYYNDYGADKKLSPRRNHFGNPQLYIINPYHITVSNGWYYLICNQDPQNTIVTYRLDCITEIQILDTPVKPIPLLDEV